MLSSRNAAWLCGIVAVWGALGCDLARGEKSLPEKLRYNDRPAAAQTDAEPEAMIGDEIAQEDGPFTRRLDVPDFPRGMEWLNTKPLSKRDLKGKFVLLDFWTYCCINCMHILPELAKLEKQYPDELVVIGVHSAKFDEEKDTNNIREAILRYEIAHPVVNDADHKIWDSMGVNSWPTILMLDPEGKAVWGRSGEFKAAEVEAVLKKAIPYYRKKGLIDKKPIAFELEAEKVAATPLHFPGKVLADEKSDRLFIADSNHNRIVVTSLDGKLQHVIGSGAIGKEDGTFETATFNHPQGMALNGETLYVADNENHMIRKVDLENKKVVTISGNGNQASGRFHSRGLPKGIELSSPWDLWIHDGWLYIAMAGPHQIWRMDLDEKTMTIHAGNGREDIVDGPLLPSAPFAPDSCSFAQPSGLSSDGKWLFVADSEGSSIRAVPFDGKKECRTVVGTADLPGGRLFAFGDIDGPARKARLQHCLGVVYEAGKIYVADTYNNKIRVVDAEKGYVDTLVGTGKPGHDDEAGTFDEPAGISFAAGKLFVADTNNHLIRTVDLATKKVQTLVIEGLEPPKK